MLVPKNYFIFSAIMLVLAIGLAVPQKYFITSTILAGPFLGYILYNWRTFAKEGLSYTAGNILMVLAMLILGYGFGHTWPKVNYRILFAGVCVATTGACLVLWGLRKRIGSSNVVPVMCTFMGLLLYATWAMWDLL
jgi:hypothetical protein